MEKKVVIDYQKHLDPGQIDVAISGEQTLVRGFSLNPNNQDEVEHLLDNLRLLLTDGRIKNMTLFLSSADRATNLEEQIRKKLTANL